jgi:hypothetical protein
MATAGLTYLENALSFLFFVEKKYEQYAFACLLDPRTLEDWTSLMKELPGMAGKGVIDEYGEEIVQKIQKMIAEEEKRGEQNAEEQKTAKFQRYANAAAHRMMAEKEFYDFSNLKWDFDKLKTDDLLTWFSENSARFPRIHALAKVLFCMPGSTMDNERVFSITGKKFNTKK